MAQIMVDKICKFCGKYFQIPEYKTRDKIKRGVYCSRPCSDTARKGKPTWNKGKKGTQPANKTSFKKGQTSWNWKNGKASYTALHQWVRRKKGRANKCIQCNSGNIFVWANKSRKYKWNVNDWISLCTKCHGKYDTGKNRGAIKRAFRRGKK